MSTSRLEAFSDGVFAIAITLLVLTLTVPEASAHGLWRSLRDEWPGFASYVVSFLVIGIIWVNHHAIFSRITRVDRPLLFLNLLLLLFVVLIPYPTNLMARYIESGPDSHVAAAFYSTTMLGMSVAFALIWGYTAWTPGLLDARISLQAARASLPRFAIGVAIYVVTIAVAFLSAALCLAIHGLIALYYVFDQTTTQQTESAAQAGGRAKERASKETG